jgi:hypothetical protein
MTEDELRASTEIARKYVEARPDRQMVAMEIFCNRHQSHALEYWEEKGQVMAEAQLEYARRVENHRNRFLSSRLKAVEK